MSTKPKVISIVGPTSSGKTGLSVELAKHLDGEIVSADSRQVYRGLDIGSGKVTEKEMSGIPHHLLDVVDPMTIYTGADFMRDATTAITTILNRGRVPIITGGTFFYIELLRGEMQAAPVAPDYTYRETLAHYSDSQLLTLLKQKDAKRAGSIDPSNRRRLIRSLEIIETLGKVPDVVKQPTPYEWLIIGIKTPKEQLHECIHQRLEDRFQLGMVDEVKHLLDTGVTHTRLEEFGLEYRYISLFLRGAISETEMKVTLETKSRQFAKRQITWLKRDPNIEWYTLSELEKIKLRTKQFLHPA